jgi:hypothetical protein
LPFARGSSTINAERLGLVDCCPPAVTRAGRLTAIHNWFVLMAIGKKASPETPNDSHQEQDIRPTGDHVLLHFGDVHHNRQVEKQVLHDKGRDGDAGNSIN